MIRIVYELGGAVSWDVESFKIDFPDGRVVMGNERPDGLRYVNKRDLRWLRDALVKSHLAGRPAAKKVKLLEQFRRRAAMESRMLC